MKLPNRDKVVIPKDKLLKYLLSETHPYGKSKARFFLRLGFRQSNVQTLSNALENIAKKSDVSTKVSSPHGEKYVLIGNTKSPIGKTIKIRTVWIIDKGLKNPRFVTAYPV